MNIGDTRDNFFLSISGKDLKAYFKKRGAYHEDKARRYTAMLKKMPKIEKGGINDLPEEMMQIYKSSSTHMQAQENMEQSAKASARMSLKFRFYEKHVDPEVMFELTRSEVDELELIFCL